MKNKIKLTVIITLLAAFNILALNSAPIVSNVSFTQRTDGSFMVDIKYDVIDFDDDVMTITVLTSNDSGATFNFSVLSLSGDLGDTITSGKHKLIVWDFANDHPNYFSDKMQIKIIADDHITLGTPCPGIPTVSYAGQIYNTVQIDDQCWLKENLNVGTMIISDSASHDQTDNGIIEKYCYDNDELNCNKYGGLYQWDEAMKYTTTEGAQGICPDGWHIPTNDEFAQLRLSVSGKKNPLLARGQNNDDDEKTDISGFSALFAGYRSKDDGSLFGINLYTLFFSSSEGGYNNLDAGTQILRYDRQYIDYLNYRKKHGYSIRCLKD